MRGRSLNVFWNWHWHEEKVVGPVVTKTREVQESNTEDWHRVRMLALEGKPGNDMIWTAQKNMVKGFPNNPIQFLSQNERYPTLHGVRLGIKQKAGFYKIWPTGKALVRFITMEEISIAMDTKEGDDKNLAGLARGIIYWIHFG